MPVAPASSRSPWLLVVVVAAFVAHGCGDESPGACTTDALEIDGRTYGRDEEHDCQFVDEDGNVIEEQEPQ